MIAFDGLLFDGTRAVQVPVEITADDDEIVISEAGSSSRRLLRAQVDVDAPISGVPRCLRLPGGELVETNDQAAVLSLWPPRSTIARVAFALEARWWTVMACLAATAGCAWLVVSFGLPLAAELAARRISPKVERVIGEQTLATLDRIGFKPTSLPEAQRRDLADKFSRFTSDAPGTYRLLFRRAGTANAFALPGGTIIVSDEMVRAVQGDDEFLAVVAHEIGHVRGRHAIRLLLQDSGLAVLMTVLAGDAVGTTILVAALPSLLLRARYSRQFEAEADEYAFEMLRRHQRSPQAFANMLQRLQAEKSSDKVDESILQYLSTHPATEERIRRAQQQR